MIKIKELHIENFFSIEQLSFTLVSGAYKVTGINKDVVDLEDTSYLSEGKVTNGLGKSSFLVALQQCLFNKNLKSIKANLKDTFNFVTNKPYKIDVVLEVKGNEYFISNNRSLGRIEIMRNGEFIHPKGISNQLIMIQNILGMDFNTFSSLTFMSQSNVSDILDLTNKNNSLFNFFDLPQLNKLEKEVKSSLKDTKQELLIVEANLNSIRKALDLVNNYSVTSLLDIIEERDFLTSKRDEVRELLKGNDIMFLRISKTAKEDSLQELDKEILEVSIELKHLKRRQSSISKGICPTCNQSTKTLLPSISEEVQFSESKLSKLDESRKILLKELQAVSIQLSDFEKSLEEQLEGFTRKINSLNGQILIVRQRNAEYEKTKETRTNLTEEQEALKEKKVQLNELKLFLTTTLEIIGSGKLTKIYIDSFLSFLNNQIQVLSELISLPFKLSCRESKGKVSYSFTRDNEQFNYSNLSSGERTRASLLVLLSLVKTLEQVLNNSVNFIVFDELLAVLDSKGIEDFKILINTIKKKKSVMIVTHHNEIEDRFFDGIVWLEKEKGLTTLKEVKCT